MYKGGENMKRIIYVLIALIIIASVIDNMIPCLLSFKSLFNMPVNL